MLNILANRMIVPEFIQRDCKAKNILFALENVLIKDKGRAQIIELKQELKKLSVDDGLPSQEAARVVLSILKSKI